MAMGVPKYNSHFLNKIEACQRCFIQKCLFFKKGLFNSLEHVIFIS